ncbi:hypothetical protein QBC38DRAFT_46902 [Podospora fimiseda]|uniref:Uncharacterized protein n=1 Tax=Podospora fimiseda TaxID=252190 RepID=A0AAN7BHP4_9PEZI|nr:hypothetical protein QBC38DRAFT_46902 [Podospora fimiseda]
MLAIDSLFNSSFFNQLRNIAAMTTPRDPGVSPEQTNPTITERRSHSDSLNETETKSENKKMTSSQNGSRPGSRITAPEPGSLYDIMHDHAGTVLYTIPICWTDLHTQLLGAEFEARPAILTPVPDISEQKIIEPSRTARTLTGELQALVRPAPSPAQGFCKNRAIKHVMSTLFPNTLSKPKTGAELDLYFGPKVFKKMIRIPCVWKSVASRDASFDSMATLDPNSHGKSTVETDYAPNLPILAYVNRAQIAAIRKNLFHIKPGPNGTFNEVVARLQALRSKQLVPANDDQDPYIVAVLIAMAQAHFYRPAKSNSSPESSQQSSKTIRMHPPQFRDIKIQLITHDEGNMIEPHFLIYTATVTATFLERFMHPHKTPKNVDPHVGLGMKISYTTVDFWPILGLKERLAKALGPEISGASPFDDPEYIDLWGPLVEPDPNCLPAIYAHIRRQDLKRRRKEEKTKKREPLAEMLNSSFEEEEPTSSDEAVLSPKPKRRRTARPIGRLEVC